MHNNKNIFFLVKHKLERYSNSDQVTKHLIRNIEMEEIDRDFGIIICYGFLLWDFKKKIIHLL